MTTLEGFNHIATLGCSNSGDITGNSWPVILADRLNCSLTQYWSNGSGNEGINIEKFISLANQKPDAIFVSLTAISRYVMPLHTPSGFMDEYRTNYLATEGTDGSWYKNNTYYTVNAESNIENLVRLGQSCSSSTDKLLFSMLITDYNTEFKIFHTINSLMNIANSFDVPVYMFSWFDNIKSTITDIDYQGLEPSLLDKYPIWDKAFPHENYMFDNAELLLQSSNKFDKAPCGHFYEDAHTYLVDMHLLPRLIEMRAND